MLRKAFVALFDLGLLGIFATPAIAMLARLGLNVPGLVTDLLFWMSLAMPLALVVGLAWLLFPRSSPQRPRTGHVVRIALSLPLSLLIVAWLGCAFTGPGESPRTEPGRPDMVPIVYSDTYLIRVLGVEKLFVFDVNKYQRIRDELVRQGLRKPEDFLVPEPLTRDQLRLVHTERYLNEIQDPGSAAKYLEFPMAAAIPGPVYRKHVLGAFTSSAGGTLLASRLALSHGLAVNLAGGYAHASADEGGGFCLIADVPIAIRELQKEGLVKRVLIIDTDAHHGQGDAKEFASDPSVRIVDFYESDIYPSLKEPVWRAVPFDPGISAEGYMNLLVRNVGPALDEHKPDLVMFVMGSDIFEGDPLTHTSIPASGLLKRDLYVVDECRRRNVPVAMTFSGGYSKESWKIHADSIAAIIRKYDKPS